jgi:type IX secretion system PorP/SprF family membrane protein
VPNKIFIKYWLYSKFKSLCYKRAFLELIKFQPHIFFIPTNYTLKIRTTVLFFALPIILFLTTGRKIIAQDLHYSQFLNAPLLLNPAMAGTGAGEWRAGINHKSQWIALTKYNTPSVSFDMPLFKASNKGYLGLGANLFTDKAGDAQFGTSSFSVSCSGILPMGSNRKISGGIQTGIVQRSANLNKLSWGNQFNGQGFDNSISSNESNTVSFIYPDIAAGVYYEYKQEAANTVTASGESWFNAGVSVFHPHMPKQQFSGNKKQRLDPRFAFHTSALKEFADLKLGLVPSLAYFLQGPHQEINVGVLLRYRMTDGSRFTDIFSETAVSFGLNYRYKDAVIPQFVVEAGNYKLAVSYDYPLAKLIPSAMVQGFEISFIYTRLDSGRRKG